MTLDRRAVLQAAVAAAVSAGCADSSPGGTPTNTPTVSSPRPTTPTPTVTGPPDWVGFARQLDGELFRPGQPGFAESHRLFNPRFDGIQPAAVVRAGTVNDVGETVRFARRYDLVLVPKSGGHSYVGASTARGGLVLDLGRLDGIADLDGLVHILPGARTWDLHVSLDRDGFSLPTGTCPTVGFAGLALGGGLGVHTRSHGLTCDRIVSLEVVTADGETRPANPKQNPELFWALRGGGGGNFGIVTEIRVAPIPAGRTGHFGLRWPESQAAAVVRGWQRFARDAPPAYWANLHVDARTNGSLAIRVVGVTVGGSAQAAAEALESMVGHRAGSRSFSTKSHLEAVRYLGGGRTSPRTRFTAGSDVLRGPMDAATVHAFLGVMKDRARSGRAGSALFDPLGGRAGKEPSGGSAWPWRSALGTIQWYAGIGNDASYRAARAWIAAGHRAVQPASAGGYVNYVEPGRAVASYYGANWNRLRAVKRHYDPTGFFRSPYGVP